MSNKEVYTITIKPYYNSLMNNEYYRHIIEINKMPKGPLKNIVKQINKPKISPFNTFSNNPCENKISCTYAIYDINNPKEFMCTSNISDLYAYILNYQDIYTIDTVLSTIMHKSNITNDQNKLLFSIIYNPLP